MDTSGQVSFFPRLQELLRSVAHAVIFQWAQGLSKREASLLLLAFLAIGILNECRAAGRVESYARSVKREGHRLWGQDAPIAAFLAQIRQESGGDPLACSKYACGLTQFTPQTAAWIAQTYRVSVGPGSVFDPDWSIRAMIQYNRYLWERLRGRTDCDRYVFLLWSYNGGLGWVVRDRLAARAAGKDDLSARIVSPFNAGRRADFFRENRGYSVAILERWQPLYRSHGPSMCLS